MRILFLTHRLPYAPNRGDRIRAFHELRCLAARHEVTLLSLVHDDEETGHAHDLDGLVRETVVAHVPYVANRVRAAFALAGRRPLTELLLHSPDMVPALERLVAERPPDVVLAYCSSMARYAIEPPLDRFPLVIDMVDADSAKWRHLAGVTRPPLGWIYAREARLLAALEARAMRHACATFAVNGRECEELRRLAPQADIRVIENGIDLESFRPPGPPSPTAAVVFCGVMDYPPNQAAAVWLADDVWPMVRRSRPDASLVLVGARPTAAVRALASESAAVSVTGSVPDVRPYLWNAAVAVAPLQVSRGVQNKVLEAAAAGLPVAVTPPVWEGLPAEVRPACRVAESAAQFAAAVTGLLSEPPEGRRAIAAGAKLEELAWEKKLQPLEPLLVEARVRWKAR